MQNINIAYCHEVFQQGHHLQKKIMYEHPDCMM